jgi:hypothetical protein
MGLAHAFSSKAGLIRQAIAAEDFSLMRELMAKESSSYGYALTEDKNVDQLSPKMLTMLLTEADQGFWKRWHSYSSDDAGARKVLVFDLAKESLKRKRFDLLDTLLDHGLDVNMGQVRSWVGRTSVSEHPIGLLLEAEMPAGEKETRLRKMAACGLGKIEDAEMLLQRAAELNFLPGVTLLAAAGLDIHAGNELLLREAARRGQAELCRHLVQSLRCDAVLAADLSQQLRHTEAAAALRGYAGEAADLRRTTVESLAGEVTALRAEMVGLRTALSELREAMTAMTEERSLDKPVLQMPPARQP